MLMANGAQAVSTKSVDTTPIFELSPGARPLGVVNELEALFDLSGATDLETNLRRIKNELHGRPVNVDFVEDQDWQNQWRRYAADEVFADRLWVVDRDRATDTFDGVVLTIEPGLAFGSGSHPTTRLCLDWLAREPLKDRSVLDFGCGSGILGVAAKLLGAHRVVCVDHDPQALRATASNAADNGLGESDLTVCNNTDFDSGERFDVVVANILANPLVDLAPLLSACVADHGRIVLSGLLTDQAERVSSAYAGFALKSCVQGEWVRLDGGRKQADENRYE